jgi:ketosteroid isomerase-like protein
MLNLSDEVGKLEALRLDLTRRNDADGMEKVMAPDMIYIHDSGRVYSGADYVREIRSRGLSYHTDITMEQEEQRLHGDTFIAIGRMRGHAWLEGEQKVFNLRYLAVWVHRGESWRLQLCQKTPILSHLADQQNAWR